MLERELVHQSKRRTTKDRNLAAGLQPTTSAQFVELPVAGRVCTDSSGDEGMRKASTALLEQGIQTPSPAPDLIPAETSTEGLTLGLVQQTGALQVRVSSDSCGAPPVRAKKPALVAYEMYPCSPRKSSKLRKLVRLWASGGVP